MVENSDNRSFWSRSNPARKHSTVLKKIKKEFLIEEKVLKKGLGDACLYLDFADVMLVVLGKDQRILKINKKGCKILGYPENKIIGKKYFDNFIPARFRQEMKEFFNDLVSGKKILRKYFENPVLTAKGERLIAWRNAVLKDSKGNIIGTISEGRDITDEREKQQKLINSEKRFRLLFENAPVGYVVCSPDGKIFDVNHYFVSFTDFEKRDLIGKNFKTIVFPEDRTIFNNMLNSLKANYELNISEFRIMRKNGTSMDVYCTAISSGIQDKMIQVILYDITHRTLMDKLQSLHRKIGLILDESLDSSEIVSKSESAIKKSLGLDSIAIFFKHGKRKQHPSKKIQDCIDTYLANSKPISGESEEPKSLISKAKVDGKEMFFVYFPLKIEDALIGVLFCADKKEGKFSPEIVSFLENTAKIISAGLQKSMALKKLRTTSENLKAFIGSTKDMAFIKDSKFKYVYVNPEYAKFFKRNEEEILGKTDFELMELKTARQCRRTDKQALKENKLVINEEIAGNRIYETRKFPIKLETSETGIAVFIRDITEEKENRQRLSDLLWMYSMLYQMNQVIVRAKNPTDLFRNVCKIACTEGRFVLAWIGIADYEKNVVVPVAGYGKTQYCKNIAISLNPEVPEGKGPTARAIRTGRLCVCNDFLFDKRMKAWWQEAKKHAFFSSAAVPIKSQGKIIGALNLYSDQRKFFSDDIKKLLQEISSDIGLCIDKLNAEEIRKKAEQRLRENEEHQRLLFENMPIPVIEIDLSEIKNILGSISNQKNRKTYLSNNIEHLRSSIKVLNINKQVFEFFGTSDTGELIELIERSLIIPETVDLFYSGQKIEQFQTKIITKSGIEKDVVLNFSLITGKEKDCLRGVISIFDITDRIYMEKNLRAILARFKGFFETNSVGMVILDLEGRPIILNQRLIEILGYSHEELMKMKLTDVVHPEEVTSVKSTYEKLQSGEITYYECERRYVRKDGSIVPTYVSAGIFFDEVLNQRYVAGVVIDITKQKEYLNRLMRIHNTLQLQIACNEIFTKETDEKVLLSSVCKELSKLNQDFVFIILKTVSGIEIASYTEGNIEFFSELRELYFEKSKICPKQDILSERSKDISNDIESSDYPDEWKQLFAKYGFRSILSHPIINEGFLIGCINILSPKKNRFIDDEENSIIKNIVEDMAYCITSVRARRERYSSILELEKSYEQLQKTIEGISLAIAKIIESRDPYTAGHQIRVAKLAVAIAKEIGLAEDIIKGIHFAGILHDIGKVGVPIDILVKPGKLTEDEFNIIKLHSIYGYEILEKIPFPWNVATIVRQHHERLDGSGYPDGVREKDILMESKIIAVADVVEAMAFDRPYRTALGIDFALNEIKQKSSILFDPLIVDVCVNLFKEKGFVFE